MWRRGRRVCEEGGYGVCGGEEGECVRREGVCDHEEGSVSVEEEHAEHE